MPKRFGKILSCELEKKEKENKSIQNVDLFKEQTSNIVEFLQKKFGEKITQENQISEIFEATISILSKKNNPNLLKKATIIFLNYIKKEFYFKNKEISKNLSEKITGNLILRPYFGEYIKESIHNINNSNIEPWREFSFIFFLNGANNNFDLNKELSNGNIAGISNIINRKIRKIKHNSSTFEIEEFCMLMEVINQLTIIQGINAEDKVVGARLFQEILIKKTKEAIVNFIGTKDKKLLDKLKNNNDGDIFYTDLFESDLTEKELFNLKKIQDMLGKFYGNFSANLEYIKNDKKSTGAVIENKIGYILDKIVYGYRLREKSDFGNLSGQELVEMRKKASQVRDGNIAFTKLLFIKKLEELENPTEEDKIIISHKALFLKDLIFIYNNICKGCIKDITNLDIDAIIKIVINHFISLSNPDYFQIITIHKLILFTEVGFEELNKVASYLATLKNSQSISFEKFKIKTFELIVQKLTQNLTAICEKLYCNGIDCIHKNELVICNKIVNKIEKYISKNNKESLVFNYGKIYLILSHLYSFGISDDAQEKSKKYFHIFNEKYGNILPDELKSIIEKIKINYAKFELKKYGFEEKDFISKKYSKLLTSQKLLNGGEDIVKNSKQSFLISETNRIQDGISKLILKIQNNEFSYTGSGSDTQVKKEICSLLEKEIFNNLCKIFIEPKGTIPQAGRFEKVVKIENEFFDIIFMYNSIYDSPFQYIYSHKKDIIKNSIIQLIDIFSIHCETFDNLFTIKKLSSKTMEAKDPYTTGHIDRVKDLSITIGKILGYDGLELQRLETKAIMHDYGKFGIDDSILKKPGKLTPEEYEIISSHTGLGIMEGIDSKFNLKTLEGMAHHCYFYGKNGNPNLRYETLLGKYKTDKRNVSPGDFNKLQGHHIPFASRIIMVGDIIDAIASRRVYDRRAGWTIEQILEEIDSELLKCSGLKRENGKIIINEEVWEKAGPKINTPSFFQLGNEVYVPRENSPDIQFDPGIIILFLQDEEKYRQIKEQIIASDKKTVTNKIIEFGENIEKLKVKKNDYLKILNPNLENSENIPSSIVFNDLDNKDLLRLEEILPQLIKIQEGYKKKK